MYHQFVEQKKSYIILVLLVLFVFSTVFYLYSKRQSNTNIEIISNGSDTVYHTEEMTDKNTIYVDIAGEIVNNGVYRMNEGDRVKDVIEKAGGITQDADQNYIDRQLNQAELISDGQKIYIPKKQEENTKKLQDFMNESSQKISINSATQSELDSLWGIGEVRAENIIKSRPYSNIGDLVLRKIIPQSVFEKIKNEITL